MLLYLLLSVFMAIAKGDNCNCGMYYVMKPVCAQRCPPVQSQQMRMPEPQQSFCTNMCTPPPCCNVVFRRVQGQGAVPATDPQGFVYYKLTKAGDTFPAGPSEPHQTYDIQRIADPYQPGELREDSQRISGGYQQPDDRYRYSHAGQEERSQRYTQQQQQPSDPYETQRSRTSNTDGKRRLGQVSVGFDTNVVQQRQPPPPQDHCRRNEIYDVCGNPCETRCSTQMARLVMKPPPCRPICGPKPKCRCKSGYARSDSGQCQPIQEQYPPPPQRSQNIVQCRTDQPARTDVWYLSRARLRKDVSHLGNGGSADDRGNEYHTGKTYWHGVPQLGVL